jgi:hypothetical protein
MAAIGFVDSGRECFKARTGFSLEQIDRNISFGAQMVLNGSVRVIADATKDERFKDSPLVTGDPHVRFWAGRR